jgi:hypothetical protein
MRKEILPAMFAGILMAAAVPAMAHHGWSAQEEQLSDLTGAVTRDVSLAGPHGTMQIRVGNVVWDVTLAPPARTSAAGLKPGVIPVGATVTVRGNKSTANGRNEMKAVLVTHGAQRYAVYPDRL